MRNEEGEIKWDEGCRVKSEETEMGLGDFFKEIQFFFN